MSHLIILRYPNKNEIWFKEKISIANDFQQVGSDLGDGEDGEQIRNIVDTVGDIVENVVPGGSVIKSVLKPTFYGFTKDLQNQVIFKMFLEEIWKLFLKRRDYMCNCKDDNARFTVISLKVLSDQVQK